MQDEMTKPKIGHDRERFRVVPCLYAQLVGRRRDVVYNRLEDPVEVTNQMFDG